VGTGGARRINAILIYAQAHSVSFGLNSLTKYAVRRPRPYTHHPEASVRALHDCETVEDECLSGYSGHATAAFTSAVAGGYLINESIQMTARSRALNWAILSAGAAATAHLRVRAGKHFYTDIVTGALLGAAVGVMVPLLHGGDYVPDAAEFGAAFGGLMVGTVAPLLVPTDYIPPDIGLMPLVIDAHGAGLSLSGTW
jgi:membrane-associated phospholipid phosphatase